ncbi:MAG: LPS-assembly protein [Variibacter sp.]|nr:LPS-assembly protein [Variibacter sp.]
MSRATTARPSISVPRFAALALFALAAMYVAALSPTSVHAQAWVGIPPVPKGQGPGLSGLVGPADPTAQMLVQANEVKYDYNAERVSAVGTVQIHYRGSVLDADSVIYDQRSKRMHAEGNVRLTEPDGKVIIADRLDLDENFRDGFVDSLHVETVDKTRFAAARAERPDSRYTIFQSGVYTACEPCKDQPQKPPKWQVKAARVLHDEAEKTIYFEDAKIELFGYPVMYLPYFWAPDPSVARKSGFLAPSFASSTVYGFGASMPYFWNIAPNKDLTLSPMMTTRQGPIMVAEWRERLMDGAYSIRATGLFQQDRTAFTNTVGDRDWRGSVETKGDFRLAQNWFYGWDATVITDRQYAPDYKLVRQGNEAISQGYLFGRGTSSYFDARALHFYGYSPADIQKQLPVVHPVVDYKYKFETPVFGGELSYAVNATSLSREQADYDPINAVAAATGLCDNNAIVKTRANCLLRGIPGTYSRLSSEAQWRKTIIDPIGQVWTPFAAVRGDVAAVSVTPDGSVQNFIHPGDSSVGRLMPAVGFNYRYPFISAHSWGSQTIEPMAQVVFRPNEQNIGRLPNEDSQSLVLSDANLFSINKFSGWDRVEGGSRANLGVHYNAQFNRGGYVDALFGQSYQLFGTNSYAALDMSNTGIDSGLETRRSDYVGRATFAPNSTYQFLSRFRWDEQTFSTRQLEVEGRVNFDRWTTSVTYGRYDAQPSVGLLVPREGVLPAVSYKITQNWSVSGAALYSIDSSRLNTAQVGLGYVDECIAINLNYVSNYGFRGDVVPNRVVMLQISLRTLGASGFSQGLTPTAPGATNSGMFGRL